jgi:hypothetical protein
VQHFRADDLDQSDLDTRLFAAVELVRGTEREQPARLDLGERVEDHRRGSPCRAPPRVGPGRQKVQEFREIRGLRSGRQSLVFLFSWVPE